MNNHNKNIRKYKRFAMLYELNNIKPDINGSSSTQRVLQKCNGNSLVLLNVLYTSLLAGESFNSFNMECKTLSSSQFLAITPVLNVPCTCSPQLPISKKVEVHFHSYKCSTYA